MSVHDLRCSIIETVESQICNYKMRLVQPKFILLGRVAYKALVLETRAPPMSLIDRYKSIQLVVCNDLPEGYVNVIPSAGDVFLRT